MHAIVGLLWYSGPTVIVNQRYDSNTGLIEPEDPTTTALIFPEKGSYCVFDGELAHGVLESFSQETRMTLLINWWAERPKVCIPALPTLVADVPSSASREHYNV
jgi:hypothetical protein